MLCGLVLLPGLYAAAQATITPDDGTSLPALLDRMQTNWSRNGVMAQQYTSIEFWHNVNFDKKGKKTDDESAKFENVFVEGLPYRKKVGESGKPLTGKAAEEEEKRYDKAVDERRGMSIDQKRHWWGLGSTRALSLPICCLTKLFDSRMVGHEMIDGRETLVVESKPKSDARPANDSEKSSLNWKETAWIDVADAMPARIEAELLRDEGRVLKGMINRLDFERLVDASETRTQPDKSVWLQKTFVAKFRFKVLWMEATGETDQAWSDYRKFRVDMRLLNDTVREVPQGTAPQ